MTKQIAVYSSTSKAVSLDGVFGSEVNADVVSTVDSQDGGCTVLRVADSDVAFVEEQLESMDAVARFQVA